MPNRDTAEAATRNSNSACLMTCGDCNGRYPNPALSINWRASLVPAAAVIPAPIAYANAAAVKKLVVGFRVRSCSLPIVAPWWRQFVTCLGGEGGAKQVAHDCSSSTPGTDWPAETPFTGRRKQHIGLDSPVWPVRGCYCEQNSVSKAGYSQPE